MGDLGRWGLHVTPTTRWQRFCLFFKRGSLVPIAFPPEKHGWLVFKTLGGHVFIIGTRGRRP